MEDTIEIIVNGREHTILATADSETQILSEIGLAPPEYRLFRDDVPLVERGREHRIDQSVSHEDGDRFAAIPSEVFHDDS
jgi:hypothetical protein